MAKIHAIETCIGCGAEIKPLIRGNEKQWEDFRAFVAERTSLSKNKFIELLTPRMMVHDEAGVIYLLCPDCCRDALRQFLTQIITRHRGILFWNFDKMREELKHGDKSKFLWKLPEITKEKISEIIEENCTERQILK